jgi:hypothetical protein
MLHGTASLQFILRIILWVNIILEIHSRGMQPFIKLITPLGCPEVPRPEPFELAPRVLQPEFAATEAAPV